MADYKVDLRDLRFVLKEQVGIEAIAGHDHFGGTGWDEIDMILQEAEKFAKEVIHPLKPVSDSVGASIVDGRVVLPKEFHDVYKVFTESGWGGISDAPEFGGMGLPHTMGAACGDMFIGACASFFFLPGLARAASRVIEAVGSEEQRAKYCKKMITGQWGGTMCLTEPQAGSAVGDLRTQAVKSENGDYYKITGNKIFISAGDQDITENIVHLVLARTPDALPGIKGVSLFIVPSVRDDGSHNDVTVGGIEEKMGLHGSPTCQLSFGDAADCQGWILGGEGEGIQHMFLMMNEARIAVGIQASSMANWAYQLALDYAKERIQGTDITSFKDANAERIAIIKHPDVRRMLLTMKAYSEGSRSLLLTTAAFVDHIEITEDANKRQRYEHLVEVLTPICKAYCSYRAFEVADLAIMVHGGYGYITEYNVEGILRDVKIAAIYEGTNGIQALDLLGRKVGGKGGMMFMTFMGWLNEFVATHKSHAELGNLVAMLESAKNTLATVTMELGQQGMKGDHYYPVLCASPYLEMFGDVVFARQLIEQAIIAHGKLDGASETETKFYKGKIGTAQFFCNQQLPRVDSIAQQIRSNDRSALDFDF